MVETMKAGRVVSSGRVSLRTLKCCEGDMEPILRALEMWLRFLRLYEGGSGCVD